MDATTPQEQTNLLGSIAATEECYFDLFGLPGELRDAIYDCCLEDVEVKTSCKNPSFKVVNGPRLSLLLLNHQFKHEYEQRVQGQAVLHVTDDCESELEPRFEELSGLVLSLGAVVLHLDISGGDCDDLAEDLALHQKWVPTLPTLTNKPKLTVNLYVQLDDLADGTMWNYVWRHEKFRPALDLFFGGFTNGSIVVFSFQGRSGAHMHNHQTAKIVVGREKWTAEWGWVSMANGAGKQVKAET